MFLTYNPVAGCLVHSGADPLAAATEQALNSARTKVSQDDWKRGHSFDRINGPTYHALNALAQVDGIVESFCGEVSGVFKTEARDKNGNVYPKLRLMFSPPKGRTDSDVISLELGHEMTLQLIQRIAKIEKGDLLIIRPTVEAIERNGRIFANHNCIVKNDADQLMTPLSGAWKQAQAMANEAAALLQRSGIKDAKLINAAKAQKKLEYHAQLLDEIIVRFTTEYF